MSIATMKATSVTLQVTDLGSQSWNNGSWSVNLIATTGSPSGPWFLTGTTTPVPNQTQSGSLNGTGMASITLTGNDVITPISTVWQFTVCPAATAACFTQSSSITGATQTVSLQPPAITIPMTSIPVTAYSASEITAALVGNTYFNLTSSSMFICTTLPCSANWSPIGGGGTIPSASPNQAVIYVSPNCNGQSNCFQVKDDGFMATDCSVTSGSAVVTCTGSHFTSAMADGLHHIAVYKTCSTDAGLGNYVTELGATGATISTFTSGTSITASANATGTVTGTACVFVASLDDTPLSSADTAAQASPTCPVIDLPSGIMGTKEPHFFTLPTSCSINGAVTGESAYLPTYFVRGQGALNTQLWWTPDFDFAACTHGNGLHACMMINSTMFRNWGITGGGMPSFSGTVYLLTNDIAGHTTGYLDGFSCQNIGPNSASPSSQIGLHIGNDVVYAEHASFDGCGAAAVDIASSPATLMTHESAFQDSGQAEINIAGTGTIKSLGGNAFYGASGMGSFKNIIQGGTVTTAPGDALKTNFGPANMRCWQSTSNLGQTFNMDSAFCDAGQGIVVQNTGVTVTLRDSQLTSATPIIISSGAPVIADYGNNTLGGAPSGTFTVTQSQSILGAQIATNITPSTGWGTTGAAGNGVSAASGTSQSERFTITATGTPTANPTVAITFPQAFWLAPQCTAQQIGGTGAIQALTTDGTESATAVTLTWHGTPAAASTYIVQVNCK